MNHSKRIFTVAAAAATASLIATGASASAPEHVRRSVGPLSFDAPAGVVCAFAVHEEQSYTQNLKRFYDDAHHLMRVEDEVDLTVLHENVESGATFTEHDHYAAHVDLQTGEVAVTGQSWNLRDRNGRVVLTGAGFTSVDLATGDVTRETPHYDADGCAALAGA